MSSQPWISRRTFMATGLTGLGAILAGMLWSEAGSVRRSLATMSGPSTVVVARRNGTIAEMVQGCVDALGGIGAFVPPGSRVAIKVNGSWNNPAGNVTPEVVRQVVLLVKSAGPSQITVYDHTIERSGWPAVASAAGSAGAEAVELREETKDYVQKSIPGVGLGSAMVAKVLDQADVLINLPKLKTHSGADVTISLKNHMGSVLDRNAVHDGGGHGLHQGIADLNSCPTIRYKHRLTICDALKPMVTGGPSTGSLADYNGILAGTDPVATDLVGTQIIRRYNSSVPPNPAHIAKAASLGLGTNDPAEILFRPGIEEIDLSAPIPEPIWTLGPLAAALYVAIKASSGPPEIAEHQGEADC